MNTAHALTVNVFHFFSFLNSGIFHLQCLYLTFKNSCESENTFVIIVSFPKKGTFSRVSVLVGYTWKTSAALQHRP